MTDIVFLNYYRRYVISIVSKYEIDSLHCSPLIQIVREHLQSYQNGLMLD
jgi:hypothetical protein